MPGYKNLCSWIIGIIFFVCNSCSSENISDKKIIEGDLFFKLIVANFYELPDSVLTQIEKECTPKTNEFRESRFGEDICFLAAKNLLRKPFKLLRLDDTETAIIYLSKEDFNKLNFYKLEELQKENKKVSIKAEVLPIIFNDSLIGYDVSRLISINEVNGKTYSKK